MTPRSLRQIVRVLAFCVLAIAAGFPHTRFSLHKSVRVLAIAAGDAAFVAPNCACPGFPLRLTQMVRVLAFSWLLLLVTPRSLRQIVRVLAFP